jgi:hypothetical protein
MPMPGRRPILAAAGLAVLALAAVPRPAAAQDLCAGIRQAIDAASQSFATLKTTETTRRGVFNARAVLPGGHTCTVSERFGLRYYCEMAPRGADAAAVRAAYQRLVPQVQRCFPGVAPQVSGTVQSRLASTSWIAGRGISVRVVMTSGDIGDVGVDYDATVIEVTRVGR